MAVRESGSNTVKVTKDVGKISNVNVISSPNQYKKIINTKNIPVNISSNNNNNNKYNYISKEKEKQYNNQILGNENKNQQVNKYKSPYMITSDNTRENKSKIIKRLGKNGLEL